MSSVVLKTDQGPLRMWPALLAAVGCGGATWAPGVREVPADLPVSTLTADLVPFTELRLRSPTLFPVEPGAPAGAEDTGLPRLTPIGPAGVLWILSPLLALGPQFSHLQSGNKASLGCCEVCSVLCWGRENSAVNFYSPRGHLQHRNPGAEAAGRGDFGPQYPGLRLPTHPETCAWGSWTAPCPGSPSPGLAVGLGEESLEIVSSAAWGSETRPPLFPHCQTP